MMNNVRTAINDVNIRRSVHFADDDSAGCAPSNAVKALVDQIITDDHLNEGPATTIPFPIFLDRY